MHTILQIFLLPLIFFTSLNALAHNRPIRSAHPAHLAAAKTLNIDVPILPREVTYNGVIKRDVEQHHVIRRERRSKNRVSKEEEVDGDTEFSAESGEKIKDSLEREKMIEAPVDGNVKQQKAKAKNTNTKSSVGEKMVEGSEGSVKQIWK